MTVSKPKMRSPIQGRRKPVVDLVPDETSESFRVIERAARDGPRASTQGLTDDEVRALLLGADKG